MEWRLADAKNRFSELVTRALAEGRQRVLRHDDAVVVLAECDYERLTGKRPGFKEFLMGEGPSLEKLDLTRDDSPMREVKFSEVVWVSHSCSYARFSPAISILFICSMAFRTLFAFTGSLSCSMGPRTEGITCQDRPYLSFSQPHRLFSPPSESFSQRSSISCCVSQLMKKEMAGVKVNCGPPLKTRNSWPSSSK